MEELTPAERAWTAYWRRLREALDARPPAERATYSKMQGKPGVNSETTLSKQWWYQNQQSREGKRRRRIESRED